MRIEVAKEMQTGFPCVRYSASQEFVSLLPVTKIQVEEWIWRSGEAPVETSRLAGFLDRLEVRNTGQQFPEIVQSLTRRAIGQHSATTLASLVAGNLSLWNNGEEAYPHVSFPTPKSEWGQVLRWLGGRIPADTEWATTVDDFRAIPTKEIIQGILATNLEWDRVVKDLLCKVEETLPETAVGLPFMTEGLYELVAGNETLTRLVENHRDEYRPVVAGDSAVWPTLGSPDRVLGLPYHSLRWHTLPVVALRLWYADAEVTGALVSKEYESFTIKNIDINEAPRVSMAASTPAPAPGSRRRWFRSKPTTGRNEDRELSPYVVPPATMRLKCIACFKLVEPPEIFKSTSGFYCYLHTEAIRNADNTETIKKSRKHSVEYPNEEKGRITEIEYVPRLYLEAAQRRPADVHVVALGGFERAGKSTWLLSLGGLMDYPDANSIIYRAFPEEWNPLHIPCSTSDLREGNATDRKHSTERMWLDGLLPLRNSAMAKAFRCPIRFMRSKEKGQQTFLPIFADQAGEALFQKEINYENFPHIASTSDAIFFMPGDGINVTFIQGFINQMGAARDAGFVVDLKRINLIFVISKIDQLKHGDRQARELFECILPRPYRFPKARDKAGLIAYMDEMREVHWGIETWLRNYKPMMLSFADFFGSVRYCGLSAFGFQPAKDPDLKDTEIEYRLPFRPEPVRVVDPLFWLLKENDWIKF